jgi:hypothetical protein
MIPIIFTGIAVFERTSAGRKSARKMELSLETEQIDKEKFPGF